MTNENVISNSQSVLDPSGSTHMQSNGNISFFTHDNNLGERLSFKDDRTDASPSRFSQLLQHIKDSPTSKKNNEQKEKSPVGKQEMIISDEQERQRLTFLMRK